MRLAVLTTGRQDWGLLCELVRALRQESDFTVQLLAGGMHGRGGAIPDDIDGVPVLRKLSVLPSDDTPAAVGDAAGRCTSLVAALLTQLKSDALVLAGDRTETLAAAVGATCAMVPIIHLHGGEETEGAVDNVCRHAITKLSHLHFVAHPQFAQRVQQMGEASDRIIVSGAPGLDALVRVRRQSRAQLADQLDLGHAHRPWILCTHHPTTLGADAAVELGGVLEALRAILQESPGHLIITRPNVDVGSAAMNRLIDDFVATVPEARVFGALGIETYGSLMQEVAVMVGNSSSGIIEAPLFRLPVVNIGDRQRGRLRGSNVLDVPPRAEAIAKAIRHAMTKDFRDGLAGTSSPYGDGAACQQIVSGIRERAHLLREHRKPFVTLSVGAHAVTA